MAGVMFNILVKVKVNAVSDNPNLLFCVTDQTSDATFGAVAAVFVLLYITSEIVALSLFLIKMRQVKCVMCICKLN